MMSFLMHDPLIITSLGWALLHFLWQGTLVALLTALLLRALPQAKHRYSLACLALSLCAVLPVATSFQQFQAQSSLSRMMLTQVSSKEVSPSHDALHQPTPSLQARIQKVLRPHLPRIVQFWALGCALFALRLGAGWTCTLHWRRRAQNAPHPWVERLQTLSRRMGLKEPIALKCSSFVDSPVVLGVWRPMILLPMGLLTGMDPGLVEALLIHELAHIHRHDYLVNLLQSFIGTLLFYHPAVWWISRRIRIEREFLADSQAAWALGEPRRLALALNALDDLQPHLGNPTYAIHPVAARGGNLMHRIQCLLRPGHVPTRSSRSWSAPIMLALALITPLAAAIQLHNDSPRILVPSALVQKIDALAQSENIDPDLLRAIAWNESHFNVDARSRMGAMGILQVMPETARRFGATNLEDPDQVAKAGAHYLRHLLDTYNGDLTKVVSAYNGGEPAIDSGQLSDETRAYTPMVLALYKTRAVQPEMTEEAKPSVMGEIQRLPDGTLKMSAHLWVGGNPLCLEIFPDDSQTAVARLVSGSKNEPAHDGPLVESRPTMIFPDKAKKQLRIRVAAGQGHWGEGIVNAQSLPASFQFHCDRAPNE